MPPNLPLATVIVEIIKHTPLYVWAILALLIVVGSLQLRDRVLSRTRLAIAPLAMGAFSLWGVTHAFGGGPAIVTAWIFGIALAIAGNHWLRWPRFAEPSGRGFAVRGSPWPLVAMLSIFALRYAIAVTLVFKPEWRQLETFSIPVAMLYGALSGLFAGRALRILRTAAAPRGLVAA